MHYSQQLKQFQWQPWKFHVLLTKPFLLFRAAIVLIASFAITHAAFKTWNFCRRNAKIIRSVRTMSWFIFFCIQTIGNYILLVSSVTCLYIFTVYKGQSAQYVSLPDEHTEAIIKFSFFIAFGAKVMEMISLMYYHRNVNVFFIDWEQPRSTLRSSVAYDALHGSLRSHMQSYNLHIDCKSSQIAHKPIRNRQHSALSKLYRDHNLQHDSNDDDVNVGRHPAAHGISSMHIDSNNVECENDTTSNWASVSTWRVCFIANQWLKIATKRKTSVIFQMIVTIIILEIVGIKFWSLAEPKWYSTRESNIRTQENFTFESAIAIGTFMSVYSTQWLVCTLYGIYVKNFLQEFVDLCSMANISVFLLSHTHLGYYIHGRSVHGFADKDLASLMNDLEYEKTNECAQRGLVPGTREQMFIVAVSNTFLACYDAISTNGNDNNGCVKSSRPYMSRERSTNDHWKAQAKVHEFFCNYLDHCLTNVDYTIQSKCFIERLCNIELANTSEKSIFYIDNNYAFDEAIFHGNEWALMTFELITFLLTLTVGGSYITCALVTITTSEVIASIARIDQKNQLAARTFIDKRFFM